MELHLELLSHMISLYVLPARTSYARSFDVRMLRVLLSVLDSVDCPGRGHFYVETVVGVHPTCAPLTRPKRRQRRRSADHGLRIGPLSTRDRLCQGEQNGGTMLISPQKKFAEKAIV